MLKIYYAFHSSPQWNDSYVDRDSNLLINSVLCQAAADEQRVKITI